MQKKIKKLAHELRDEFLSIRHHLHRHPELSYKEYETSAYIKQKLKEWDIPFREGVADTGIVAHIEGRNPNKKVIALRADMDALPIQEENEVAYKSQNKGVMHACGHDVHMTTLLGTAKILKQVAGTFEGTFKLIFQPGEERAPGGASLMIRDGALENPKPDAIIGMHVDPDIEMGHVGFFEPGISMASADEIFITVKGNGGHAATPHLTTDTILVASHIVVGLQQLISRNKDPLSPSVLSICSFNGGHTTNVIPKEVKLIGTFRALDEEWRYKAHDLIKKEARAIAEGMGAEIDLEIPPGYPGLESDKKVTTATRKFAETYLGKEQIKTIPNRMGGEDFAFYTKEIPACFYRLGVGNKKRGITSHLHTPTFNVDEDAIEKGVGLMTFIGIELLKE